MIILGTIAGVILGGAITLFTQYLLWKVQQETRLREKVFDLRVEAYKKLWNILGRLQYYDRTINQEVNYLTDNEYNKKIFLELNEIKFSYGPFFDHKTRENIDNFLIKQRTYYEQEEQKLDSTGFAEELENLRNLTFENSVTFITETPVRDQVNLFESIKMLLRDKRGSLTD